MSIHGVVLSLRYVLHSIIPSRKTQTSSLIRFFVGRRNLLFAYIRRRCRRLTALKCDLRSGWLLKIDVRTPFFSLSNCRWVSKQQHFS